MSKKRRVLLFMMSFLLLPVLCGVCYSQTRRPLELSSEMSKALEEFKKSYKTIVLVQKVMHSIAQGEEPEATRDEWEGLARSFSTVAQEIRHAPLPTEFDREDYTVRVDALVSCETRKDTLATLDTYKTELKDVIRSGKDAREDLNQRLLEVKKIEKILTSLLQMYEALSEKPVFRELFGDWLQVDSRVRPALGTLESAVKKQIQGFDLEIRKVAQHLVNFPGNLELIIQLPDCNVEGIWSCTENGIKTDLIITSHENGLSGKIAILFGDGDIYLSELREVRLSSDRVLSFRFKVGEGEEEFIMHASGQVNAEYTQIEVTFSTLNEPPESCVFSR